MLRILELFGEPILSGGQESFVMNVITHMDLTDLKIDLCTPYYCSNNYYKKEIENIGGNVYELKLDFAPGKSRKNIIKPLDIFLKKHNYDIVHIHSGSISILAYAAKVAKQNNVRKVIVHSHSSGEKETLKHKLVKLATYSKMINYPDEYLACSTLAAKWKFPQKIVESKVKIIKNGIDLDKFQYNKDKNFEIRKLLGISENDKVIGHVGRFSYEKNHKFIIEIFEEIKKDFSNSKLLLIGDGELKPEIEDIVKRKNIQNYVIFTGNVSDVYDYMQVMDIFLFPSLFEGLGIVGIEAQAMGIPVIASEAVPKQLQLTENVEFISLENKNDWINTINKYINVKDHKVDNSNIIKEQGYDICDTGKTIREIYLKGAM